MYISKSEVDRYKMTLEEYRIKCGWSLSEMARKSNIDFNTLKRAFNGEPISVQTARKLATAISKETGQTVTWDGIEGLNINL
jgi:transcriptional regulator with XRE-family HTH domain